MGIIKHDIINEWWLGIDESGNETIHQHEPHYNRLQGRWKSQSYIYVSKGMVSLIINQTDIDKLKEDKIIAGAFEVISLGQKAITRDIIKIYK